CGCEAETPLKHETRWPRPTAAPARSSRHSTERLSMHSRDAVLRPACFELSKVFLLRCASAAHAIRELFGAETGTLSRQFLGQRKQSAPGLVERRVSFRVLPQKFQNLRTDADATVQYRIGALHVRA